MKTIFVKEHEQDRKWYLIDATDKPIGRVAAKAASILRGKNKPSFTANQNMGDYVVIINVGKAAMTGAKQTDKIYYNYTTGFVGSLKKRSYEELIKKHPEEPMRRAINGMLPSGRLGRTMAGNVKIYAGAEHPHSAQNPQPIEI
ncbi:50S ribosomal protein L13 [Treponema parvum]|uniref:Large ribosomal subunit protein uL13 n=1 Tax=Treponema parvum TaxID=138851 RepID=A0A975F0Q1_9SPIR|nr:50S ribosomal protein L13 [Treponema parvum]QTQ12349.1 50S ribosomal protein L13 [Treponema parvum]QTQ13444.1 50S ribosomal protein L13 [Treponema parvum]QTQ15658.1 50S ribosomal protein L13 [Treponema parvum]